MMFGSLSFGTSTGNPATVARGGRWRSMLRQPEATPTFGWCGRAGSDLPFLAPHGSPHGYKYRLAYVVRGECVLRYDNEVGKGDHRHFDGKESTYVFTTPDRLIADFRRDIARWNHENRDS